MNNNQGDKVYDIRERLLRFSRRIISLTKSLPRTIDSEVIIKQMVKSGTSIGANFEEADGALTKKDFINKVAIARKEAKETKYWLKIIAGNYLAKELIEQDIKEAEEIICILSAILKKLGYQFRL
ncbi:MAG: four helix bundle protein [Candidatus Saganbacteria bacterium]|nr:four helix bundle protein [Candidatus Saganbacteria bacterium]